MSIVLGDNELAETSAQLDNIRQANSKHQETLAEVLGKYGALIESYKRLKSDYEEERESRERYKQLARGQERNPFVLVLVDGDGYIFDDDLVSNVRAQGKLLGKLLRDRLSTHQFVGSIRGQGLFWGIEFVRDKATKMPFDPVLAVGMGMHELGKTVP